ncbi:MAG: SH3 domain-containing protein [Acidobacteria bacterium]|nr:SH3 domain-containing protein [Acidobacteriota bacterium]
MKRSHFLVSLFTFAAFVSTAEAQKRRFPPRKINKPVAVQIPREPSSVAIVVDERLAVLRSEPSLFSKAVLRMQNGRKISVLGSKEADGVTFYRITAPPNNFGWYQFCF